MRIKYTMISEATTVGAFMLRPEQKFISIPIDALTWFGKQTTVRVYNNRKRQLAEFWF